MMLRRTLAVLILTIFSCLYIGCYTDDKPADQKQIQQRVRSTDNDDEDRRCRPGPCQPALPTPTP
jgi:hypothetical protein